MTQAYSLFSETWPAPVREHWKLYWWAWLMPDRDIKDLVQGYVGAQQNQDYIKRTGDWRGNASVYRTYCRAMGTMNFNHWAANGTLLGGAILGSEAMLNEGRYGLEKWPLRTWCWFDGSTQESIDHYYFSISLKDQKVFADFGPTAFDRMMGRNILAKSVGELAALHHPSLKRFISSSGRTGIAYLLSIQDGTKHIVHTLSKRGALTDVGRKDTLEAGFKPGYTGDWDRQTPTDQCFVYRRVNGAWPYLAKDIERDTTLGQMSRTGRAEKGGAVLTVEPGRMACVEFEPVSGAFVGYTPLPDATSWKFQAAGGIEIEADGKVGLLRVTVWPKENRLRVEHARRPGESPVGLAGTLRIRGMNRPQVELNQWPAQVDAEGRLALITPR